MDGNKSISNDQAEEISKKSKLDTVVEYSNTNESVKPVLVLVNPKSGRGKSLKILRKVVIPMLKASDLEYQVFITEQDKRVPQYLNEANLENLDKFRSIVVVSGDGLLHEAINTLLSRSDWQKSIRLPLGIVPTGSGNGMAYTLVSQSYPNPPSSQEAVRLCCQQALQTDVSELDLVKIQYGTGSELWSFLSLGWGLLSDIDVDSDWLRLLGELRFTIYGLLRSCTARSYRGKLSYKAKCNGSVETKTEELAGNGAPVMTKLSENAPDNEREEEGQSQDNWVHIEDEFSCVYAVYQAYISRTTKFAPKSKLDDQTIYLTYVRGKLSVKQKIEFLLAIEDGSHEKLRFVTVVPVESFILEPLEPSKVVVDGETIPWTLSDGPLRAEIVPKLLRISWSPESSS